MALDRDEYTYEYNPVKTLEENVSESLKMDRLRTTMAPTVEQLKARAEAGRAATNGFNRLGLPKGLDNQMTIC